MVVMHCSAEESPPTTIVVGVMVSEIVVGGFVLAVDSIRIVMMWVTRVKLRTY